MGAQAPGVDLPAQILARWRADGRDARITHVEQIAARQGRSQPWPAWVPDGVIEALVAAGVSRPWVHQVAAAELARAGRNVVVATGTASGKSLAYLLPALSALHEAHDPQARPSARGASTLYLSPTKALAADQLRSVQRLNVAGVRAATYDGDASVEERDWARAYATYLLTNPDMLHRSMLPGHERWAAFLRTLRYVVVDECHSYRGVFGSHVAAVLRRLRRICARYDAEPTFVLASATVTDPALAGERLVGQPIEAVVDDASPHGGTTLALWEPPLIGNGGENGAPVRRAATAETADLLADLVGRGVRTVAFVRSRRGVESVAASARRLLDGDLPGSGRSVAAYRGGYLPEERRELERALDDGRLLGMAATTALELGIDVQGLDAVLLAGWPGTRASLWQQVGRAGRARRPALAVLVARDEPLDTYLVHHPDAVFGRPIEATVLDPANPYVLTPQLAAAAAELPLTEADADLFGPQTLELIGRLEAGGLLRHRPAGWFWTGRGRASDLSDIRGVGGPPVRVVEVGTGRLLGTVDAAASHTAVHRGAVYVHQGVTHVVDELDLDDSVAFAHIADVDYATFARSRTEVRVLGTDRSRDWGPAGLYFGQVEVTTQVVSFLRRRVQTGQVLGEEPLDLPPRTLTTRAVWWTLEPQQLDEAQITPAEIGGAAHAAEHASIGLLPLFATCDRWDIGGLASAFHPDTGRTTVFVHDGHPGGAGFAERGFQAARAWLTATREAVLACECAAGCPSCVQSPKCGNGNHPLDKAAAVRLLGALLSHADADAA